MTAPKAGIDFLASNNALIATANELVFDTFTKVNNTTSWGTPTETGTAWVHSQGTATTAISGNRGTITGQTGGQTMLAGATAVDMEGIVRFTISNTTGTLGIVLRATGATTFYRAVYNTGTLKLQKIITGTVTALSSITKTITAGSAWWMRFRIQGSTLQVKMWADAVVEPVAWDITLLSETSITTAGQSGLGCNLNAVGDIAGFDHLFTRTLVFGFLDDPVDIAGPTDTETNVLAFHPTDTVTEVETPLTTEVFSAIDNTPVPADIFSFSTTTNASLITGTDQVSVSESALEVLAFNTADTIVSFESTLQTLVNTATDQLTETETSAVNSLSTLVDSITEAESSVEALATFFTDQVISTDSQSALVTAPFTDTVLTISELLTELLALSSSDLLSVAETKLQTLAQAFTDQATLTDTQATGLAFVTIDSLALSDTPTLTLSSTFVDPALTITDTLLSASAIAFNLVDVALILSDVVIETLVYTVLDTLTTSETTVVSNALSFIESTLVASETVLETLVSNNADLLTSSEISLLLLSVTLSDATSVTDTISSAQSVSVALLDSALAASETVLETLISTVIEVSGTNDTVLVNNTWTTLDSLAISENSSMTGVITFLDTLTALEVVLDALVVTLSDALVVLESLSAQTTAGPQIISGTDQLTLLEVLLATNISIPFDQLGTIFDQSTTTGILAPIEQSTVVETLVSFAGLLMSVTDQLSVIESLVPTSIRLYFESITTFEFTTITVQSVLIDVLTPLTESIVSLSGLNITGTDSLNETDSAQSVTQWTLIDSTPVGEGLAALPFALTVHLTDVVSTTDTVQGLVASPLFDIIPLPFDTLGATFTLTFADTLIASDASSDAITAHFVESTTAGIDGLAFITASPLLTDQLVPLDSIRGLVFAPLGPDTLQLTEQFLSLPTTFGTVIQRVRSGVAYMVVRSGVQTMRVRSGNANMAVRTGQQLVTVRSGNANETMRQ